MVDWKSQLCHLFVGNCLLGGTTRIESDRIEKSNYIHKKKESTDANRRPPNRYHFQPNVAGFTFKQLTRL